MKKTSSRITFGAIATLAVAICSTPTYADDKDPLGKPAGQDTGQNTTDTQNRNLNRDRTTTDASGRPGSGAAMTPSTEFIKKAAQGGAMEVKMGRLAIEKAQNPAIKQFGQTLVTDHSKVNQQLVQLAARKGVMLPPDLQQQLAPADAGVTAAGKAANAADQELTSNRQQVRDKARPADNTGENAAGVRDAAKDSLKSGELKGDAHADAAKKGHGDQHMAMEKLKNLSGTEFDKAFTEQAVQHHQKAVREFETASQMLDDAEIKQFAANTLPVLKQHLQQAQSLAGKLGGTRTGLDRDYKNETKPETKPD